MHWRHRRFGLITTGASTLLLCLAAIVEGNPKDLYWTDERALNPPSPVETDPNDPKAGWTWPSEWKGPNQAMPIGGLEIRPGFSRYFGLENEFVPQKTKEFWISFAYSGGGDPFAALAVNGIHFDHWRKGARAGKPEPKPEEDNGSWFTQMYTVEPQPDWEWICITNMSQDHKSIIINPAGFQMWSECVPEPASLCFLAAGALVAFRKRAPRSGWK